MRIEGKVALITGASSGIGEALAFRLSEEGAAVILGARREDLLEETCKKINERGGKAICLKTDVAYRGDLERLVKFGLDKFGQIDILINNAGVMPLSYVENLDYEGWEDMVDINFKGVLHGVAAVLPHFLDKNDGHIINISSDAGQNVFPGGAVYCATKLAVNAFTEGLRQELSPRKGIRVTCVMPGATLTELANAIEDPKVQEDWQKNQKKDMRMLLPEDVADTVLSAITTSKRACINEVIIRPTDQF